MDRKPVKSRRAREGRASSRPVERLSASVPVPALTARLSESQIGVNYMLQMEDLLPQEVVSGEDVPSPPRTSALSARSLSGNAVLVGASHSQDSLTPLMVNRDPSQCFAAPRARTAASATPQTPPPHRLSAVPAQALGLHLVDGSTVGSPSVSQPATPIVSAATAGSHHASHVHDFAGHGLLNSPPDFRESTLSSKSSIYASSVLGDHPTRFVHSLAENASSPLLTARVVGGAPPGSGATSSVFSASASVHDVVPASSVPAMSPRAVPLKRAEASCGEKAAVGSPLSWDGEGLASSRVAATKAISNASSSLSQAAHASSGTTAPPLVISPRTDVTTRTTPAAATTAGKVAPPPPWSSLVLRAPTILVTAVVMILGVLLVAVIGFIPVYVAGFREVDSAVSALQYQATSDLITASSMPIEQLPQLTSTILARAAMLEVDGRTKFIADPEQILFSLASVLYMNPFRELLGALQFVDATRGKEMRALVSNIEGSHALAGMIQSRTLTPNRAEVFRLDSTTFRLNLSGLVMAHTVSLQDAIYGEGSAFKEVVAPWNRTFSRTTDPTLQTLWKTFEWGPYFAYLDFVVPVRTGGGHLGYLEAMLRSSSVMRLAGEHLFHALRKGGRYFVVDPNRNLIIVNSWNQSLHMSPEDSQYYSRLYLKDVKDPLAAATVKQLERMGFLGPSRETRGAKGQRRMERFRFGRDTAWVHVYNYASDRVKGLNMIFVVVTLESDYFASVYHTRTVMVRAMFVVVLVVMGCSYLGASYVVRSLNRLIADLQTTKNLQFDENTVVRNIKGLSIFTELLYVQLAYARLQRQLIALKTLLPGPLLVPTTDFTETPSGDTGVLSPLTPDGKPDQAASSEWPSVPTSSSVLTIHGAPVLGAAAPTLAAHSSAQRGTANTASTPFSSSLVGHHSQVQVASRDKDSDDVSASQSELVTALIPTNPQGSLNENLRISRKWRQDMRLNTKIFNEQVNVFQRRYCSVLFVCCYYTQEVDYGSLNRYFAACYAAAAAYNGCLEFLRPDYAVCTFGAHTQMPMHATRATQCALAIYNAIPVHERDKINYVIDSNEFLVGTCGAQHGKKGRVLFDVIHIIGLVRICRLLGYRGVMATQSTASRLPDYQSVPVDCVYEETFTSPFVLCEVREPSKGANLAQLAHTAKRFREAFHYMTKGRYSRALRIYQKIGPHDPTAVRLANTCRQRIKQNDHRSFITIIGRPHMNLLSRILANKNMAPFLRMQRQYMLQVLGGDILFRPGHVPPLRVAQGMAEPSAVVKEASRHCGSPHGSRKEENNQEMNDKQTARDPYPSISEGNNKNNNELPSAQRHRDFFTKRLCRGVSLSSSIALVGSGGEVTTVSKAHLAESSRSAFKMPNSLTDPVGGRDTPSLSLDMTGMRGGSSTGLAGDAKETPSGDAENGEDGALFEWIEVASGGSSFAVNPTATRAVESSSHSTHHANEDSLVFIDDNGRHWSRSLKAIGDGAFSVVYLGMSEDGVQVAIKCIPRRRRDINEDNVRGEMRTMAELRHPNIVQYIGFCATKTHLSIIMEYVPGGSLYAFTRNFGRLDVTIARRFLLDLLSGLAYLHTRNIVHCDVKPHNMLIGMDGICKLSDFGSTISEATDFARSDTGVLLRGTALYTAPEVARGERCTPQSDIYSLGISLLEMLTGRPPWRWSAKALPSATQVPLEKLYRNDARFVQLLSRGDVEPHILESLDREVFSFCQACCQADPAKRPTAKQLMSFPFVL